MVSLKDQFNESKINKLIELTRDSKTEFKTWFELLKCIVELEKDDKMSFKKITNYLIENDDENTYETFI